MSNASGLLLWGIQYRDYVSENFWFDWEPHDLPDTVDDDFLALRFATETAAEQHVARLVDHWTLVDEQHREKRKKEKALYRSRVKALKDAGLWAREGEREERVLRMPPGPPRRTPANRRTKHWRVVQDADMTQPVLQHREGCDCDVCSFGLAGVTYLHVPPPIDDSETQDFDVAMVELALQSFRLNTEPLNFETLPAPDFIRWW